MVNKGKGGKHVCFCRNKAVFVSVFVFCTRFSISLLNVVLNDSRRGDISV